MSTQPTKIKVVVPFQVPSIPREEGVDTFPLSRIRENSAEQCWKSCVDRILRNPATCAIRRRVRCTAILLNRDARMSPSVPVRLISGKIRTLYELHEIQC